MALARHVPLAQQHVHFAHHVAVLAAEHFGHGLDDVRGVGARLQEPRQRQAPDRVPVRVAVGRVFDFDFDFDSFTSNPTCGVSAPALRVMCPKAVSGGLSSMSEPSCDKH